MPEFLREDHGRRDDRPGESAAAGFIDSGDPGDTNGAESLFIPESATRYIAANYPEIAEKGNGEIL